MTRFREFKSTDNSSAYYPVSTDELSNRSRSIPREGAKTYRRNDFVRELKTRIMPAVVPQNNKVPLGLNRMVENRPEA